MIKVTATLEKCKQFYSATGSYFVFMSLIAPAPSGLPRSIATPCVKLCVVDGATSLCLGCWRTLSEIGGWSGFTDEERAEIMAALPGREAAGIRG
jgi:predicted Fe-S protein YdhL (DUF1289 family)